MKNKFLIGIIIVLILLLIGSGIRSNWQQNKWIKELKASNELVLEKDQTIKEKDGQYAKLVNYFENNEDLMKSLKNSNKDLAKLINKQNEKLLQISDIVATFEEKLDQGDITQIDDSTFQIGLFYPDKDDWFINWDGFIFPKTKSYKGIWKFGELNLQAVLTETERGLWNARLIGPDFLIVDSITVKSLPPDQYNPYGTKKLEFMIGGGYRSSLNPDRPNAITVGAGVQWKNNSILMIEAGTNNTIGFQYFYKFQTLKKKKR